LVDGAYSYWVDERGLAGRDGDYQYYSQCEKQDTLPFKRNMALANPSNPFQSADGCDHEWISKTTHDGYVNTFCRKCDTYQTARKLQPGEVF